eukprot:GHVS01050253.1.p1 GENE.GHVS01050253.1~~GHVS01050253.1.p1  ORF type:complete len:486 (+),score=70.59 GHVS01050253.1:94-1458(+)
MPPSHLLPPSTTGAHPPPSMSFGPSYGFPTPPASAGSPPQTSYFTPSPGTGRVTPVPLTPRSRISQCPYPMPEAVNYSLSGRATHRDSSAGLGKNQYCYYGKDGSGMLRASVPVRFVSESTSWRDSPPPPTGGGGPASLAGRYVDTGFLSAPVAPQYMPPSRNSSPQRYSSYSCCPLPKTPRPQSLMSPPRAASSSIAFKRKKPAHRPWDEDFDFAITDLFPCISDWISAPNRAVAGDRKYADERQARYEVGGEKTKLSKRESLFSRLFGERCALGGGRNERGGQECFGMGRGGKGGGDMMPMQSPRLHEACQLPNHPTVDTVCIQCGEILRSHPLDLDDAKISRILETEVGNEKINKGHKVSKEEASRKLAGGLNSVWEYSDDDDEDDKVPLPQFEAAPPRKFLKSSTSKKKSMLQTELQSASWVVPDELGGDVFPTDDCGKVALPAFPLSDS